MSYIDLKYRPSNDVVCDFSVEPATRRVIEELAAESSVGTWTDVPRTKRRLAAKAFYIKNKNTRIAYPAELFESDNIPQILSSIAGNIFGMKAIKNLRLEDIEFPRKIVKSFKGPELGLKEIRKMTKIKKRPLVGTIVKPKLGLTSKEHARVAYEAWLGGLDLVKCDENLTSQKFNKFETNISETMKMLDKAEKETGEKKIYVPNVTAETKQMIKRAKLVKRSGGDCVMVDIVTMGWSALQSLRGENLGLIIHAHRAGHGMFTRGRHGMSMLAIAKIARMIGVSQIHIGTANVGKMESGEEETQKINTFLKSKWFGIKPIFSICSGGLHAGSVPKLVRLLGNDIIIQAGGGVHGLGTRTGAKSMRQAVEAVVAEIPLEKYAKTHKELKSAIDKWGIVR
ncbi:MAG: type III ribulose-bisphosphate carboxylase [Candidatus Aenigmarchaeota archaeon]|nr:type III ribulose-bisphosphate carboxylase [Candidatus Aenigmarchaeota archaeon]